MVVAWRIYHLTKLGREVRDHPRRIFFQEAEWKALYILANKTKDLPPKEPTMREAVGRPPGRLSWPKKRR
ncbi:MAG: IS4 family transposase [Syntrophobacteraceae bacterium]